VNLEKEIAPGTWRSLGLRCPNIAPHEVPIAGASAYAIHQALGGTCYEIEGTRTDDAFLIIRMNARFLYVHPGFRGYRRIALRVFPSVPWKVDFDHALARSIALKANPQPSHVLMLRVPPDVNRKHGHFEKRAQLPFVMPDVYFADDRVFDKWLGRPPRARNRSAVVMVGYSPENKTIAGLSLKQRGRWAYAIGMSDEELPSNGLISFTP
jgi:hypothetical protein